MAPIAAPICTASPYISTLMYCSRLSRRRGGITVFCRITSCQNTRSVFSMGTCTESLSRPPVIFEIRPAAPLRCKSPRRDRNHPHIANRVFQVVGFLAVHVHRHVFQRLVGRRDARRAPQRVVGDRVVVPRQAEGHGVEVVLRTVDGVGNHRASATPIARDGVIQRLQQHDVVVSWGRPLPRGRFSDPELRPARCWPAPP